jgi:hypothetical protein
LGRFAPRSRLETAAVHVLHGDPLVSGELDDVVGPGASRRSCIVAPIVVGLGDDPHFAHLAHTGDEEFAHRLATLDLFTTEALVGLAGGRHGRGRTTPSGATPTGTGACGSGTGGSCTG